MKKRAGHGRKREEGRRTNAIERRAYLTARWARVRRLILSRDNGLCQECVAEGKSQTGNQVDHILSARKHPELFWVLSNLQTLCQTCHSRKTQRGD